MKFNVKRHLSIKQHKEVLPDGIFKPKVIKKTKKEVLEKALLDESKLEMEETWKE